MTQYYMLKKMTKHETTTLGIYTYDGSGLASAQSDLDTKVNADLIDISSQYPEPEFSTAINTTDSNCKGVEITHHRATTTFGLTSVSDIKFISCCYSIEEHTNA